MPESGSASPETLDESRLARINRLTTIARFVSGVAHEMNNALQVISGLVELLADRTDLPSDAAVRIQKIGGQTDRASAVIRQLLTFVRDPGVDGALDLGTVVESALALRRYQLGRVGIAVVWTRPAERFRVKGNERALEQLVVNLLMNAEEALEGAAERRLSLALVRMAGHIQLSVSDTGHGVPPDLREQIFEPFFTTRASDRAVGLGLTVGETIAATHGGRLVLSAAAPGATTFVLELPEHTSTAAPTGTAEARG